MAKLSRDDVLKLAKLAKLNLTEEEIEKFRTEISAILSYVEKLSEVDVTGLEPTTQVTGLRNILRKDSERNYGLDQAALLKNVPNKQGASIKVRRVL